MAHEGGDGTNGDLLLKAERVDFVLKVAERVGFEPTIGFPITVFELA